MAGNERVDVLIIGSGASGAAMAWSLADTKMRILCLEQGDWVRSTEFPSNGRDWEARRYTDFDISPNRRGRDTDYPVNDDNSVMKIANFNGVGGGTVIYTAHWPRIGCPVLLLSGDRDPFAKVDLLRREASSLRNAELVIYPGLGHGLLAVRADAAARIAAFLVSAT